MHTRGIVMLSVARVCILACVAWTLATPLPAESQWVFVARKTIGKVKEMTQSEKTGEAGYSVATVMVSGQGAKVHAAALKAVQSSQKLRLTKNDPEKLTLEFANGKRIVGLQVMQVEENVAQLLIASATVPGKPDETSLVVSAGCPRSWSTPVKARSNSKIRYTPETQ